MGKICLDAGVIALFFEKKPSEQIQRLKNEIQNEKTQIYLLKPVLCEVFYHLCRINGKEAAKVQIIAFLTNYKPTMVGLYREYMRDCPLSRLNLQQ
jgi:predicted nucleic acid-binding protein